MIGGVSARVALATCRDVPGLLDDEGRLLRDRLRSLGVDAEPAVGDDPDVAWASYDLVLVRSTWDYPTRHAAFLASAEAVARVTALHNPAPVLAWTTDKHHLLELAEVLEVELAEPSLFLGHAPVAVDRLAGAVVRRLR